VSLEWPIGGEKKKGIPHKKTIKDTPDERKGKGGCKDLPWTRRYPGVKKKEGGGGRLSHPIYLEKGRNSIPFSSEKGKGGNFVEKRKRVRVY